MATKDIKRVPMSDEERLLKSFLEMGSNIYNNRTRWYNNQQRYKNLRRGVKKDISWPFENAANMHIPVLERIIRNQKATIHQIQSIEPPVLAEAMRPMMDKGVADKWARHLSWRFKTDMRGKSKLMRTADTMYERDRAYVKVTYERKTEIQEVEKDFSRTLPEQLAFMRVFTNTELEQRFAFDFGMSLNIPADRKEIQKAVKSFKDGADKIRVKREVVVKEGPAWHPIEPEDILVLPNAPAGIQENGFFIHRFWQTVDEIRTKEDNQFYMPGTTHSIKHAGDRASHSHQERLRENRQSRVEGVTEFSLDIHSDFKEIETWEAYLFYTPKDQFGEVTGERRRAVFTFFPVYHYGKFARAINWDIDMWPLKEFEFDNPDNRPYASRGIVHLFEDIQLETNFAHNNWINASAYSSVPTGTYDPDLLIQETQGPLQIQPGQLIPGKQGSIGFLNPPKNDLIFQNIEQSLIRHAEATVGQVDSVLNRAGSPSTPRSATEMAIVDAISNRVGQMDVEKFQEAVGVLWEITIRVMARNMPEEQEVEIGQGLFDTIRRSEVHKLQFRIRPHGNLVNSNKALEAAKWQGRIAFIKELPPVIPDHLWSLYSQWLLEDGIQNPEAYLPMSVSQMQEQQAQQQFSQNQMGGVRGQGQTAGVEGRVSGVGQERILS